MWFSYIRPKNDDTSSDSEFSDDFDGRLDEEFNNKIKEMKMKNKKEQNRGVDVLKLRSLKTNIERKDSEEEDSDMFLCHLLSFSLSFVVCSLLVLSILTFKF